MVSPDTLGGDVNVHPVGSGPFQFVEQVHGDRIVMERFDNHWGQRALPDTVTILTVPEPATRWAMLYTGDAHAMQGLPADYAEAQAVPHLDVFFLQASSSDYIGFNTYNHPYLSNVRVRQAISMAINRQDILTYLRYDLGIIADSPLPPFVAHAPQRVDSLPYDPVRAREILEEEGLGDGFTLSFWYNTGNAFRAQVAEYVQANLADIGITIEILGMEWSAYLEATGAGQHDMFILGWVVVTGDADYGVFPLFHTDQMGDPGNRSFYSNPVVDDLLERGRMSSDPAERDAIYLEIAEILAYDVPKLFLQFTGHPYVTNGIDGLVVDFAITPYFYNVSFRN